MLLAVCCRGKVQRKIRPGVQRAIISMQERPLKPLGCRNRRLVFVNTCRRCPAEFPVRLPVFERVA